MDADAEESAAAATAAATAAAAAETAARSSYAVSIDNGEGFRRRSMRSKSSILPEQALEVPAAAAPAAAAAAAGLGEAAGNSNSTFGVGAQKGDSSSLPSGQSLDESSQAPQELSEEALEDKRRDKSN